MALSVPLFPVMLTLCMCLFVFSQGNSDLDYYTQYLCAGRENGFFIVVTVVVLGRRGPSEFWSF